MENFLLGIPKEKQIRMLEDALKENKFNIYLIIYLYILYNI